MTYAHTPGLEPTMMARPRTLSCKSPHQEPESCLSAIQSKIGPTMETSRACVSLDRRLTLHTTMESLKRVCVVLASSRDHHVCSIPFALDLKCRSRIAKVRPHNYTCKLFRRLACPEVLRVVKIARIISTRPTDSAGLSKVRPHKIHTQGALSQAHPCWSCE